jgi:CubicO group peptidase (beta-lactamase class C family)
MREPGYPNFTGVIPSSRIRERFGWRELGRVPHAVRFEPMRLVDMADRIAAEEGLSGVIRVDLDGSIAVQRAYGLAHRGLGVPTTVDTQFGIASGSKGFTALTVMSLVERGELDLDTTARSVLGTDLPLIDDSVTVEQLLAHRAGIGDYLDEDELDDNNDYVLTVPVHELATTEQFLAVLDGHPMKHEPGSTFSYCNGGYVVLALLAERASGVPFHDLVDQRVCRPAGMTDTSFLRSDELPGRAAVGYLDDDGLRTNVLHLPVRGNGDGGIYTTAADVHGFWDGVFAGAIISPDTVAEMMRSRSEVPEPSMRYGLGFWLYESTGAVSLHGFDAGVGFVSVRERSQRFTYTVLSNKSRGAWPVSQSLSELLATAT